MLTNGYLCSPPVPTATLHKSIRGVEFSEYLEVHSIFPKSSGICIYGAVKIIQNDFMLHTKYI